MATAVRVATATKVCRRTTARRVNEAAGTTAIIPGRTMHVAGAARSLANNKENPMGEQFGIGEAVAQLRAGHRVRRGGWNGKGMWLGLQLPDAQSKMTTPYVFLSSPSGDLFPWNASQADLLAIDWEIAD